MTLDELMEKVYAQYEANGGDGSGEVLVSVREDEGEWPANGICDGVVTDVQPSDRDATGVLLVVES